MVVDRLGPDLQTQAAGSLDTGVTVLSSPLLPAGWRFLRRHPTVPPSISWESSPCHHRGHLPPSLILLPDWTGTPTRGHINHPSRISALHGPEFPYPSSPRTRRLFRICVLSLWFRRRGETLTAHLIPACGASGAPVAVPARGSWRRHLLTLAAQLYGPVPVHGPGH